MNVPLRPYLSLSIPICTYLCLSLIVSDRHDRSTSSISISKIACEEPNHNTEQGVLSPDGSCKTFSAAANGYARGEPIVSLYVKSLDAALRDGNPIRSVISGTAFNFDGKTPTLSTPSPVAQEALIRRAYKVARISSFGKTGFFVSRHRHACG